MRNIVKASEVTGVKVKNLAGEHLGQINELVINKTTGKVNYAVLDFGGFLGFGNKYFALPWEALTYSPGEDCFIVNADKEHFNNAPGFDKDHWPNFAAPDFASIINDYYKHYSKE